MRLMYVLWRTHQVFFTFYNNSKFCKTMKWHKWKYEDNVVTVELIKVLHTEFMYVGHFFFWPFCHYFVNFLKVSESNLFVKKLNLVTSFQVLNDKYLLI